MHGLLELISKKKKKTEAIVLGRREYVFTDALASFNSVSSRCNNIFTTKVM